jgi:hypothetical protein
MRPTFCVFGQNVAFIARLALASHPVSCLQVKLQGRHGVAMPPLLVRPGAGALDLASEPVS